MEREIIKKLIEWKTSKARKPLIIHGARPVSYTHLRFSKEFFSLSTIFEAIAKYFSASS